MAQTTIGKTVYSSCSSGVQHLPSGRMMQLLVWDIVHHKQYVKIFFRCSRKRAAIAGFFVPLPDGMSCTERGAAGIGRLKKTTVKWPPNRVIRGAKEAKGLLGGSRRFAGDSGAPYDHRDDSRQ